MKTAEEIREIVDRMENALFDKINEADDEYWLSPDPRVRRNAYRRLVYSLKKVGLTVDEFWLWCSE